MLALSRDEGDRETSFKQDEDASKEGHGRVIKHTFGTALSPVACELAFPAPVS